MRNLMMQLGTGLSLVFALGSPSTALAYPPQCMDLCSCASSCTKSCYQGTFHTTCADEICVDYCRGSDTQASVTEEQQESQVQQDAEQDVCTEQAPSAES
jgi:hypothetical protein